MEPTAHQSAEPSDPQPRGDVATGNPSGGAGDYLSSVPWPAPTGTPVGAPTPPTFEPQVAPPAPVPGTFVFVPKRPIAERLRLVGAVPSLVLAFAVLGGLIFDFTAQAGGQSGLGWALFFAVIAAGLAVAGRSKRTQAMEEAGGTRLESVVKGVDLKFLVVIPFLIVLMTRRSPWVVWVNIGSLFALLAMLIASPMPGGKNDFSFGAIFYRFSRLIFGPVHGITGIVGSAKVASGTRADGQPRVSQRAIFSVLVAIPVVGTVIGLLASADALFASLFVMEFDNVPAHIGLFAVGATMIAGYIVCSRRDRWTEVTHMTTWFTRTGYLTEVNVMVGGLAVVLGLFGLVQIVAIAQGAAYIERKTGLTYAEYARNGFFQLLAVVCLVFVILTLGRSLLLIPSDTESAENFLPRSFRILASLVSVLTIALVAVSLRRISLYNDAYGHTMLRLSSSIFAGWLGVCMAMVGLTVAGFRRSSYWLPKAVFVSALFFSLGYSAINPEARVVSWNIAQAKESTKSSTSQPATEPTIDEIVSVLDQEYFDHLADDATPTIVRHLGPKVVLERFTDSPCKEESFWTWNFSAHRARSAACSGS